MWRDAGGLPRDGFLLLMRYIFAAGEEGDAGVCVFMVSIVVVEKLLFL